MYLGYPGLQFIEQKHSSHFSATAEVHQVKLLEIQGDLCHPSSEKVHVTQLA